MIKALLEYVDLSFLFDVVVAVTTSKFTIQNVNTLFARFFTWIK